MDEAFYRAITAVSGKARHENFYMAVLGHMGQKWPETMLKIIRLILVMRYMPTRYKQLTRVPIPKPGRPDEYRPLSICDDVFCFVNGIAAQRTAEEIEKAGILYDGIAAYRKGKGCAFLNKTELVVREDIPESQMLACQIDEDEEKFFDRISTDVIMASMAVAGFPEQGYIELKGSTMTDRKVHILRTKGWWKRSSIAGWSRGTRTRRKHRTW